MMLHVREAHPGERYEQVRSFDEKMQHARELQTRDRLPWPVAVDDAEGSVHHALDEKPNAAYLTDRNGTIVFRSLWIGDEWGLFEALESAAHGERPREQESCRPLVPMGRGIGVMRDMVHRSGPRAEWDIWQAAPPMAEVAWLADLYRPLPPVWRMAAALAALSVVVGAGISLMMRTSARRT
ncbi:hypothetical protein [Microvirga sp. G4-2]|uniref:hypothetical protein n=1 Tax=Microvirga sp. G4-2 TaxID=3434467 RepID=UPI004044B6D7